MSKNAVNTIMLLASIAFLLSSCSAFRSVNEPSDSQSRVSKGSEKHSSLRGNVVSYAKKFKGVKYKYAGQSPRAGFDCSGFTSYVLNHFELGIPRSSTAQAAAGRKISLSQTKPGDLIFFSKKGRGNKANHVALVVENQRDGVVVIHSTTSRGVIVQNISNSSYWKPKIMFARDVIGRK
ncbi:MAG: C40 family peptidase [Bacteroidota bacterium]